MLGFSVLLLKSQVLPWLPPAPSGLWVREVLGPGAGGRLLSGPRGGCVGAGR